MWIFDEEELERFGVWFDSARRQAEKEDRDLVLDYIKHNTPPVIDGGYNLDTLDINNLLGIVYHRKHESYPNYTPEEISELVESAVNISESMRKAQNKQDEMNEVRELTIKELSDLIDYSAHNGVIMCRDHSKEEVDEILRFSKYGE